MAVTDYSTVAASNTTISSIPLGENAMAPSDVNNAFRQLMADIANGIVDEAFATVTGLQPLDETLTALAVVTFAANKGLYATGTDAFSTYDLTAWGRTVAGHANAAALMTALGGVSVSASSLAKPGYIKFDIAGTLLTLQWGSGSLAGNTTGSITYPQAFTSFAVCLASGGAAVVGVEGGVRNTGTSGLSSQAIINAGSQTGSYTWFAIGV